jgi:signal transduction histidine kinase
MSRAVELLVDVAALEGGRVRVERERVSVRSLVDQRIHVWKQRYPDRASSFRRRVANGVPAVEVDTRWIERALDELADNAVKYTPAGTAISVLASLTEDGRQVRVSVKDNGPGFDPGRAAELLGDFSQADPSETRKVGGMGLGLGFVSRVAERLDLNFSIDADPGRGCEFALLLPVADAEAAGSAAVPANGAGGEAGPRRRSRRATDARSG